jgi:transformation/transcription domain-associated protein
MTTELRDNIDVIHTTNAEYDKFLRLVLPLFFNLLKETKPQFLADNPEQKLRNMILEILNRLPNNEAFRQWVKPLLKVVMFLLSLENEENALICLRIIIDLHKNYRPTLEPEVQPFFDIVIKIYEQLPNTVNKIFSEVPAAKPAEQPGKPYYFTHHIHMNIRYYNSLTFYYQGKDPMFVDEKANKPQTLIRAISSFKVLTECPIIVVLLLQLYTRLLPPNMQKFLPLIVQTLSLQAPSDAYNTHRAHYTDFIAAQVKVRKS